MGPSLPPQPPRRLRSALFKAVVVYAPASRRLGAARLTACPRVDPIDAADENFRSRRASRARGRAPRLKLAVAPESAPAGKTSLSRCCSPSAPRRRCGSAVAAHPRSTHRRPPEDRRREQRAQERRRRGATSACGCRPDGLGSSGTAPLHLAQRPRAARAGEAHAGLLVQRPEDEYSSLADVGAPRAAAAASRAGWRRWRGVIALSGAPAPAS